MSIIRSYAALEPGSPYNLMTTMPANSKPTKLKSRWNIAGYAIRIYP